MNTLLILFFIINGQPDAKFIGEYVSPAACARAYQRVAPFVSKLDEVKKSSDAVLLCVPRGEV